MKQYVLNGRRTYRNIPPEFGHIVVVGTEKFCEPANGPLAAFVHCLVPLKVLIVFVYGVICQVHIQLILERQNIISGIRYDKKNTNYTGQQVRDKFMWLL